MAQAREYMPHEKPRDQTGRAPSDRDALSVFDKLGMGVIRTDASLNITYVNPSAASILSKSKEELEGKLLWDLLPTDLRKSLSGAAASAREQDREVSLDAHCRLHDRLWFLCRFVPSPDGFTIFLEDITELKKAQDSFKKANEELEARVQERTQNLRQTSRRLEEQKELLLTIIDNIPVMLTFYDSAGAVRLVNRAFEQLAGWSLEEARNMNLIASSYPDPAYRKEVWEHMMKSSTGWKDFDLTTRPGRVLPSSWAYVRLSDGSQIGIGIDISERRKMERRLLRLASAIEQADEGVVIYDREWRIEYVNPAYEAISGLKKEDLIGKPLQAFQEYLLDTSSQDIVKRVVNEGKAWNGRQKRKKPTGEVIDISLAVSPVFGRDGAVINYVSLVRDITEEIRFQQQILQVQKMEALGNLAGGIAQNLKNAFTPILIDTETLMADLGKRNPAYPILEEMMHAIHHGIDLVKHLLTFSRKTPQHKEAIDIVPLAREALGFLRASLPSTVMIRSMIEPDSVEIMGDPTQIKQVLVNLGSNAGHFMRRQGGLLEIEIKRVSIGPEEASRVSPDLKPGPYAKIKVCDTGPGMSEEAILHIFEPFFTTEEEGAGLGLSVVHGIVKEHEGVVIAESVPGRGATFTVYLPVQEESEKEL